MLPILQWIAVVCFFIGAVANFYRFSQTKNKGHLFIAACLLLGSLAFLYVALSSSGLLRALPESTTT